MDTIEKDEMELDLRDIIRFVLKRSWIVVISMILTASAGFIYCKYVVTPQYASTAQLYIMSRTQSITDLSLADLQIGTQLTKDYMVLIKSRPVMEEVIDDLSLDMNYAQLQGMLSVTNPTDTRILVITVTYPDRYKAKKIVDAITVVACRRITEIMDLEEPNIIQNGYVASSPCSPNTPKYVGVTGLAGIAISLGVIILLYVLDDSLKSIDDIPKYLDIPALGAIPLDMQKKQKKRNRKQR